MTNTAIKKAFKRVCNVYKNLKKINIIEKILLKY